MQIDLNIFRTKLVTDLQHNYVRRQTHNSAFSSKISAHYKEKVFPDGECLNATIKDTAQCISCTPINLNNIIPMKCDLWFCDGCTKYIIPDE